MKIDQQKAELLVKIHRKCTEAYMTEAYPAFYLILVDDTISILLNMGNCSIQEAYDPLFGKEIIWVFRGGPRELFYKETIRQEIEEFYPDGTVLGGLKRIYTASIYTLELDVEIEKLPMKYSDSYKRVQ